MSRKLSEYLVKWSKKIKPHVPRWIESGKRMNKSWAVMDHLWSGKSISNTQNQAHDTARKSNLCYTLSVSYSMCYINKSQIIYLFIFFVGVYLFGSNVYIARSVSGKFDRCFPKTPNRRFWELLSCEGEANFRNQSVLLLFL